MTWKIWITEEFAFIKQQADTRISIGDCITIVSK